MRVKKFEARSMKEALQMVKKELGPDAVILAARDNHRGFGLKGEASVEITAAVSEHTLQKKRYAESRLPDGLRERFQESDARTQRSIIERMVESKLKERMAERRDGERRLSSDAARRPITQTSYIDIPDEEIEFNPRRAAALERASGRNVRDLLNDFEAGTPTTVAGESRSNGGEIPNRALSRIRNAAKEAWQSNPFMDDDLPPPDARRAKPPGPSGPSGSETVVASHPTAQGSAQPRPSMDGARAPDPEIATLKSEISRLQKMLEGFQKVPQSFVTMHPGAEFGIPYDLSFMFQKLSEAGVNSEIIAGILKRAAQEIDPVQIKKRPIVDAWVARWFLGDTAIASAPVAGRVHLFVGGAGSGKTSTLVKMASHLVVKEKKKVAILSTDAFKVGAVDQLKIYCQILNVPFAVIRNRKDWEWIMGQLSGIDHILVDFPGLQLRDLDEIHLLKSLLPPHGSAPVCHFCVSATSKDGDAYEIARRYRVTGYGDIILTNLDQSVQHGIAYNLQKKTGKPLHSFGIGNRIPEDFEFASKERVLDLIFKLTKLRREMK